MSEELADLLWYAVTIADHHSFFLKEWPTPNSTRGLFEKIVRLENKISSYLVESVAGPISTERAAELLSNIFTELANSAASLGLSMDAVAGVSVSKIESHWLPDSSRPAEQFDRGFPAHEQLPRQFSVDFLEIPHDEGPHELIVSMNNVHLGDRLTDNNHRVDGYRYHDIFHLAAACYLGWSPVFRRMLKRKRKSDPEKDNVQDGGRAAILEEAIVGQIFAYARQNKFLAGMDRVDADLIKLIQALVEDYEVSSTEPWEWQEYIVESVAMFRKIRNGFTGQIVFNADLRKMWIKTETSEH
ncbi:MAG: hypothetical protein WEB64_13830 [Marinobacter sp.]